MTDLAALNGAGVRGLMSCGAWLGEAFLGLGEGSVVPHQGDRPMTDLAALNGAGVHKMTPRSASLGDAYLELTEDSVEYRTKETAR